MIVLDMLYFSDFINVTDELLNPFLVDNISNLFEEYMYDYSIWLKITKKGADYYELNYSNIWNE